VTLSARLTVSARDVDLRLDVADGETVAVVGPNGSGKSTTLAVLAGLVHPDDGEVVLDGRTLVSTTRSVWVPPYDRDVALLAQDPLLFPHLSVLDNVAFGPRSRGASRTQARRVAHEWLERVGAEDLAGTRPGRLSGGQAQRVAVARALATSPRLLLLDEPMRALDVEHAPALRQLLRAVLRDRSAVIVTHDVLDAVLLADRVVVVADGRVAEAGPTARVLSRPTSAFAARVAGLNLVRGRASGTAVVAGALRVEGMAEETLTEGAEAVAVFSPSAVGVYREAPNGSPRNVIRTRVTDLVPHGRQVRVDTPHLSAEVTPAALAELALSPGDEVVLAVKASEVAVYPA
jgi:molybdate transport system ATP-binding protein